MKFSVFIVILFFAFCSCSNNSPGNSSLAAKVDSLNEQIRSIKEKYRPGLGEIMSGVQMHHAKLWYAGTNKNWMLAQYETDELNELLHFAQDVETERPEIKNLPMIFPALDNVNAAVRAKDSRRFGASFEALTATCNSCHRASHFEFNIITIPTAPPVNNQDFRPH